MESSTREYTSTLKAVTEQPAPNAIPGPPPHSTQLLPQRPVVVIEAKRAGTGVGLRELWAYRELLFFLAWRDVQVRYKQTLLGVIWVVMQPLLTTLIFTVFLGILVRVPSDGKPYPLFVYIGLLPWTFFSSAVIQSGNSIVTSAHLITKVYFPRLIIPAAAVAARLVDFAVSFVILVGLMIHYRVGLTMNVTILPLMILLVTLLALGLGMLVSALNVKYRDMGVMLPVLVQLWMFVSPVLYPLSLVPEKWRGVYSLNPMVGIITGFRSALLNEAFNWRALTVSAAIIVVLFFFSIYLFRRVEKGFADVI